MSRRALLRIVIGAALVASGCGSSSSVPTTKTSASKPALTRAQYVAAGNKICRATVSKSPAFPGTRTGKSFNSAPSLFVPYLQAVQQLTFEANKGFRILRPPPQLQDVHRQVLAAQDARITDMGLALNAAASDDNAGLNAAVRRDVNVDAPRYVAAATAAGLRDCVRRTRAKR
jgi:hypothetical protein